MSVNNNGQLPLVVLCGATATGKTALALELAERFNGEIISADSRQVFRWLDIGTAKATAEERRRVPHHLLDVVDPDEEFTAADFARLAREAIDRIHRRGRRPFVVGGTGLYLRILTEGLVTTPAADPALRNTLHQQEDQEGPGSLHRHLQEIDPVLAGRLAPGDLVRIVRALEVHALTGRRLSDLQAEHAFGERPYRLLKIGLDLPREQLYRRIDERVLQMLAAGLPEEVLGLLRRGFMPELKAMRTIGYREWIAHLQGECSADQAVALIQKHSRHYAKRQGTWFRHDPEIIWVDSSRDSARIHQLIELFDAR
jgi:tRNA dimethylallyltransferase